MVTKEIPTPKGGWNQLHPNHPSQVAAMETYVTSLFATLVKQYGLDRANQFWTDAAATHMPVKKRGRPQGSRTRTNWLTSAAAHHALRVVADDPKNAGLTRWQVFYRAAKMLDDGHQLQRRTNAEDTHAAPSLSSAIGSNPQSFETGGSHHTQTQQLPQKLNSKESVAKKQRLTAIHLYLERLQATDDQHRTKALNSINEMEAFYQDDEITSKYAAANAAGERLMVLAAWPPLPQSGGRVLGRRPNSAGG